jgi:hypothetical protein
MKSESFGRLIAGPVGSGKTTSTIMELIRRSCEQTPGKDGLRHTRFAIVRQTLSQLRQTVLKDIQDTLGNAADWRVSESTVYVSMGDVRSEWLLLPLEDIQDQRRLLSSQLTGAWISEAIEIDVNLVAAISGRCGRYPSGNMGVPTWFGMLADTNMPSEGSPWWQFMIAAPVDWQMFYQPSGLSSLAENLNHLVQTPETLKLPIDHPDRIAQGRKYYERLERNNNADWVQRYVHAKFGSDPSGSAVFRASFKRSYHVVDKLEPVPGRLLVVGQDFGRDPWAIITQLDHRGRFLVLEEVPADDIGLQQHIRGGLRPALFQERYLNRPVIIVGDPAGISKNSHYEENSFDLLKAEGLHAMPAQTNRLEPRLRAVEHFMLGQVQGDPMFVIDGQRCPKLVQALDGGYRFGHTKVGEKKPSPDKNSFSHIADALQYSALGCSGEMHGYLVGRVMNKGKERRRPQFSSRAWT